MADRQTGSLGEKCEMLTEQIWFHSEFVGDGLTVSYDQYEAVQLKQVFRYKYTMSGICVVYGRKLTLIAIRF